MSGIQKIIFVALVVGIFFIALNVDIRPKRTQFKLCRPAQVSKVSMTHDGKSFDLVKNATDSGWEVEYQEDAVRADYDTVQKFLTLACFLPYREEFLLTAEAGDTSSRFLADYGLEPPAATITVFSKKTVTKYFGNPTPTGTEYYYTHSGEKDKVYTIPSLFHKGLVVTPFDFRNRVLFPDTNQYKKITLSFAGIQLELKREGKSWSNPQAWITEEQANGLVTFLSSFYFKNYHGPLTESEFAYYGVDNPDLILEMTTPDSKVERYTLSTAGTGFYYLAMTFGKQTYLPILFGKPMENFFTTLRNIALNLPPP